MRGRKFGKGVVLDLTMIFFADDMTVMWDQENKNLSLGTGKKKKIESQIHFWRSFFKLKGQEVELNA